MLAPGVGRRTRVENAGLSASPVAGQLDHWHRTRAAAEIERVGAVPALLDDVEGAPLDELRREGLGQLLVGVRLALGFRDQFGRIRLGLDEFVLGLLGPLNRHDLGVHGVLDWPGNTETADDAELCEVQPIGRGLRIDLCPNHSQEFCLAGAVDLFDGEGPAELVEGVARNVVQEAIREGIQVV